MLLCALDARDMSCCSEMLGVCADDELKFEELLTGGSMRVGDEREARPPDMPRETVGVLDKMPI